MKKRIDEVRDFLVSQKERQQKNVASNKLTDGQLAAANEYIASCDNAIKELDAMEEDVNNEKVLEAVGAIFDTYKRRLEQVEESIGENFRKLEKRNTAPVEKKKMQMRIRRDKAVKGVKKNYTDLSAYTPEADVDFVPSYRPLTGLIEGVTVARTTKSSKKVRTLTKNGSATFAVVPAHGFKPTIEMVGAQSIVNATKFAGIVQGIADEDIWEDGNLVEEIEHEGVAELNEVINSAIHTLLENSAQQFSNPYNDSIANADMRSALLAAITQVRVAMGNRSSQIVLAMNATQWALLADLRNSNGTPISDAIILDNVVKVVDNTIDGDNFFVWAKDYVRYEIYKPLDMKWHDDGVRVVRKLIEGKTSDQAVYKISEAVTNAYTAWQVNEHDLLVEESALLYARDNNLIVKDNISNVISEIR